MSLKAKVVLLQSNLDIMPPIGTEVKWHSSKSSIVTRVCYSIDETINATNKTINDYSVCKVHVTYSPSYLTQAKTLKNRQLSHVLSANLVIGVARGGQRGHGPPEF